MMNRRGFLGSIAAFAAQCTLDPELALWKPGAKTISIPKPIWIAPPITINYWTEKGDFIYNDDELFRPDWDDKGISMRYIRDWDNAQAWVFVSEGHLIEAKGPSAFLDPALWSTIRG